MGNRFDGMSAEQLNQMIFGTPPEHTRRHAEDERLYSGMDNPNYRPYHVPCNCFNRLTPTDFGWECKVEKRDFQNRPGCGAKLDHDFVRITESKDGTDQKA